MTPHSSFPRKKALSPTEFSNKMRVLHPNKDTYPCAKFTFRFRFAVLLSRLRIFFCIPASGFFCSLIPVARLRLFPVYLKT